MLLYAMSRGALQGGRELRLRVRHKKPKRLLRSWYNLVGKEQAVPNGVNSVDEGVKDKHRHNHEIEEQVQKDTNHRHTNHEMKEPTCNPLGSSGEHSTPGKIRLNGNIFHGGPLEKIVNGKCHTPRSDPGAKHSIDLPSDKESECEDNDLVCSVCAMGESEPPNEIVICDTCNKGFHQACHTPKISDQVLLPNIPWHCRNCVPVGSVRKSAKNYKNGTRVQMFKLGFPYNMKSLQWDQQHKANAENCYCYCGGPGEWNMKMLQCRDCRQWFHEACIQGLETPLLYGDSFYYFTCSVCNNGPEVVKRMQLTWMDITHLTLYNLVMEHHKKYYDLDEVILPYLNSIWLALQLPSDIFRCPIHERRMNIYQCLCGDISRFKSGKEVKKRTSLWGLRNQTAPPIPGESVAPQEQKSVVPALPPQGPLPKAAQGRAGVKNVAGLHGRENGPKAKRQKRLQNGRLKNNATRSCKPPNGLGRNKASIQNRAVPQDPFASDEEAESSGTEKSNTFLDAFIPPLQDFHGGNHPFHDVVLSPAPPQARSRLGRPPRKRTFTVPLEPAKLKLRGSRRRLQLGTADTDSEDCSSMSSTCTSSTGTTSSSGTTTNTDGTDGNSTTLGQGPLQWKEAHQSTDTASGSKNRFSVLAKRICEDGKVQYLLDWDNCGNRS